MFALVGAVSAALVCATLIVAPVSSEQRLEAAQAAVDVGDDATAAAEFVAAYDALPPGDRVSALGALVVDEAADAHRRLYDRDRKLTHLERERDLLVRHLDDLDAAGSEGVRREQTFTRLTDVERRMLPTTAPLLRQAPRSNAEAQLNRRPAAGRSQVRSRGDGAGLWISGLSTIAAGGAQAIVGVGLGASYFVQAEGFSDNLSRDNVARENAGCTTGTTTSPCPQLDANIDTWRRNGRAANVRATLAFSAAAVGVLAVGLGVGLYIAGNRRRTKSKSKSLCTVPATGWTLRF